VIDCASRKIVPAYSLCEYVTLSYVCGPSGSGNGLGSLEEGHCLGDDIPRVMEDAIEVAKQLGFACLWVDKYCVDQEDEEAKGCVIRSMDGIHAGATLTLIAAAGDNPHHGLPGVSTTRSRQQESIVIGGVRYVVFRNPKHEVERSSWSSRAWTYQEGLLSRRRLVFTESQVYFQCLKTHCWEGLHVFPPLGPNVTFCRVFPADGIGRDAFEIVYRLHEYAPRKLPYDTDILNAVLDGTASSR